MSVKGSSDGKYKYQYSTDDNFSMERLNAEGFDPGKDVVPKAWGIMCVLGLVGSVLAFLGYGVWTIAAECGAAIL